MADDLQKTISRLNGETARISWQELERHYARGVLINVDPELDLVMVAAHMVRDDKMAIEAYLDAGQLRPTTDEDARDWGDRDPTLWAAVVAPWVLVQERNG